MQNLGRRPIAGPKSGPLAFDESELMPQSSRWSLGGDHVKVSLSSFLQMVAKDRARCRAYQIVSYGGSLATIWSWYLDAFLHLSYESLLTFSDRESWRLLVFEKLKSSC